MLLIFFLISSSFSSESNLISPKASSCCTSVYSDCQHLGNDICDDFLNNSICWYDLGDCMDANKTISNPSINNKEFLSQSNSKHSSCNFTFNGSVLDCEFKLLFLEVKNCVSITGSLFFNSFGQAVLLVEDFDGVLVLFGKVKIEKVLIKSSTNSKIIADEFEVESGLDFRISNSINARGSYFRLQGNLDFLEMNFEITGSKSLCLLLADSQFTMFIDQSYLVLSNVQVNNLNIMIKAEDSALKLRKSTFKFINSKELFELKSSSLLISEKSEITNSRFSSLWNIKNSILKVKNLFVKLSSFDSALISASQDSFIEFVDFSLISSSTAYILDSPSVYFFADTFFVVNTTLKSFSTASNIVFLSLKNSNISQCRQSLSLNLSDKVSIKNSLTNACFEFYKDYNQYNESESNQGRMLSSECALISNMCPNGCLNISDSTENIDEVCIPCKKNTYIDHSKSNDTCFECPEDFSICENQEFKPNDGYYKFASKEYSLVIRKCPNQKACIGSTLQDNETSLYSTKCEPNNYEGDFCHTCSANSTKISLHICSKCPSKIINAFIIIGLIFMISFIAYYLIKTTISSAFIAQEMYSMGIKIFVNYFQIIYLCLQYKLKWPEQVKGLTSSNNDGDDNSSGYFFSLKCLLDLDITEKELFYFRTYFMVLMPIFLFIGSWIYYWVLLLYKNMHNVKLYRTVILIIPFLLVYPSVITYSLAPLACLSLSKGRPEYFQERVKIYHDYLIENRDIKCDNDHYVKITASVLVGVIVWGISGPGYIFYQIYKSRKNLFEHDIKFKYGFLFNGYLRNRYYWEFIIFIKKLLIVFLTVFMESEFNSNVQSILVVTLLILFLILQIYYKPYFHHTLNNLETFACLTGMVTILAGIIFTETSSDQYIISNFLILVIFVTNFTFVIYWLKFMTREMVTYLIKSYSFLSRFRKDDGFEDDISKTFVNVKYLYIKEYQKLYTPIDDEDESESEQVFYKNSKITKLYTDILQIGYKKYKNNQGPNSRNFDRRPSRFF